MATLEEIKAKLRHIESEVAEVRTALEQWNGAAPSNGPLPATEAAQTQGQAVPDASAPAQVDPAQDAPRRWPDDFPGVDKGPLREIFAQIMKDEGIEDVEPIGAEELQERMRQDGIKAEDNIFSRGIIEMREE